jgi:hypothetical protein
MVKEITLSKEIGVLKGRDVFKGKKFVGDILYNPERPSLGHLFTKAEIKKARKRYETMKKKGKLYKIM